MSKMSSFCAKKIWKMFQETIEVKERKGKVNGNGSIENTHTICFARSAIPTR